MSPEQLRIYNNNRLKRGMAPLKDENGSAAPSQFVTATSGVFPFTPTGLGEVGTEDFKKSISNQLDDIASSTQFLFDAYDQGVQAAKDAKEAATDAQAAYDDAQDAQSSADAAMQKAIDANTAAIQNAQDIVTLGERTDQVEVDIGVVSDEYTTQWGVKTNVNGIVNGVGLIQKGSEVDFVVDADKMIFTDGTSQVSPFSVSGNTVYIDNAQFSGDLKSSNFVDSKSGWELTNAGNVQINGSDSTGRMEISATTISIYDGSTLRVQIGKLS